MKKDPLYELAEEIRRCTACPLWKKRLLAVPGEGSDTAQVMFIGEAPGADEDKIGQPFVGISGKYFFELLDLAELKKETIFVTNAVKCHPFQNRTPFFKELNTCQQLWLKKQIEIIQPKLIILLGRVAIKSLLPQEKIKLTQQHGKIIVQDGQKYFLTFHPAAARRFPTFKKMIETDFQKIKNLMKK